MNACDGIRGVFGPEALTKVRVTARSRHEDGSRRQGRQSMGSLKMSRADHRMKGSVSEPKDGVAPLGVKQAPDSWNQEPGEEPS
jgi:hypothetical protein